MVEGPIDSIKQAMNTPTGQGVKAGLTKAFGGTTGDFSRSSKSSVLQGINTDMLKIYVTLRGVEMFQHLQILFNIEWVIYIVFTHKTIPGSL